MTNTKNVSLKAPIVRMTTRGKTKAMDVKLRRGGVFFVTGSHECVSRAYLAGEISQLIVCGAEAVIKVSDDKTGCSSHFKLVNHLDPAEFFLDLSTAISVPITKVPDPSTLLKENNQNKTKQYLFPKVKISRVLAMGSVF